MSPRPTPPPVPPSRFLTVDEVAYYLAIGKTTTQRLIAGGELRAIRVGRSVRIHHQDLRDYITRARM